MKKKAIYHWKSL